MANLEKAVEKVMEFLQISDKGIVKSQISRLVDKYNDDIQDAEDKIEDLEKIYKRNVRNAEDELEQLKQEEKYAFMTFDISRCKKRDDAKAYVIDLDKQFDAAIKKVKAHEELMKSNTEEYESEVKKLKDKIESSKYKLNMLLGEN